MQTHRLSDLTRACERRTRQDIGIDGVRSKRHALLFEIHGEPAGDFIGPEKSRPVDLLGVFHHPAQEQVKVPQLLMRAAKTDPDFAGDTPMAAGDFDLRVGKQSIAPDAA